MGRFDIDQKAFDNIFERFKKTIPKWHAFVEISFLPDEMKEAYRVMIDKKAKQIGVFQPIPKSNSEYDIF